MRSTTFGFGLIALALSFASGDAAAQGRSDSCNFETPVVRPLELARVGGRDYLLVCNTPDSSLEIYDTAGLRRVARVRTGLEPVSVRWSAQQGACYTCNAIGDSITRIVLTSDASGLRARLDRSEWVGDSPMDLAFSADGRLLFVTHESMGALSLRDARSLRAVAPGFEDVQLVDDWLAPVEGLKEPRQTMRVGDKLFVLGFRGGHSFFHDFDLWSYDFKLGRTRKLGGLGTQKAGMRVDSQGRLWVVGGDAENQRAGQAAVAAAPTGFVRSLLHRIDGAGSANARVATRDLNRDRMGQVAPRARALAQPYDLAIYEGGTRPFKVFVAAFGSDRVGVVDAADPDPAKWSIRAIDIPLRALSRGQMAGPRGLVFKPANPTVQGDPGDRIYCFNRIDASVYAIDPMRERVVSAALLANDPVPDYVRRAQHFLYSAKLSGNGFVSCASCHLDGRTDGLAWDLSDPKSPKALDPSLLDGVTDGAVRGMTSFPATKGRMVTQRLQGLVQGEAAPGSAVFFSTVPHHWRADQDFQAFNGAYVDLQGMANIGPPQGPKRGISARDMRFFEEFVHSIHYPPNPEQAKDRRFTGTLGDPDKRDGSLALRGLKLFHTEPIADGAGINNPDFGGRSCVQCHSLPDGSNHRITRTGVTTSQPVESATLRGLQQKEAVLERGALTTSGVVTGEFGLEHSGSTRSINDFNTFVFGHDFQSTQRRALLDAMTRFVRELDHGVAPIVGFPVTIDQNTSRGEVDFALAFLRRQAHEAGAGLVAQVSSAQGDFGYSYDPVTQRWTEEDSARVASSAQILAQLRSADDRVVLQAVPLGDERRLASVRGKARVRRGPAPSALALAAMRPMVAYRDVPRLTKNWAPGPKSNPLAFFWDGKWTDTRQAIPTPPSLQAMRVMQHGLIQDGDVKMRLRHEASRRFRVSGSNIRPGARLVLLMTNDPSLPPGHAQLDKMLPIDVPIYATGERNSAGRPIYESSVEASPRLLYSLLLGGPAAPGVKAALDARLPEPPARGTFRPKTWNRFWLWVINEDGSFADGGWQALRLSD